MSDHAPVKKLRVLLADDHFIFTQLSSLLLEEEEDIEVLQPAHNGAELEQLLNELHPDIIISDIEMPGRSVFELSRIIENKGLCTKVILFSMHQHPQLVFEAMESHVAGFLTKNADKEELLKAIRHVQNGYEYYSDAIRQIIIRGFKQRNKDQINEHDPLRSLSKREKEVLVLLAEGFSSSEIGERLFVSPRTISNHRANMLKKCKVSNTIELVRIYLENENKW